MAYATEAQRNFVSTLLHERDTDKLDEVQRSWLNGADFASLSKEQISRVITTLRNLPRKPFTPKNELWPGVPEGRYAIVTSDGVTKFFRVDRPTEGRWAGRVFVSTQASDDYYPVKSAVIRAEVMARIAEDPKAAMLLYGVELGHCGHCGRTLTNEVSRELGIGPVCRARMGW